MQTHLFTRLLTLSDLEWIVANPASLYSEYAVSFLSCAIAVT